MRSVAWVTVDCCQLDLCESLRAASRMSTWYLSETAVTLIAASVINLRVLCTWHQAGR